MRPVVALAAASLLALATVAALLGGPPARAQDATIAVGDLYFCDSSYQNGLCETTVSEGDTVLWQWTGGEFHTTTECAGDLDVCPEPHLWDSPAQNAGTFSFAFDTPGTYLYRCQVHPLEMRGQITVLAAAQTPAPTPQPSPQTSPTSATPTPAATGTPAAIPSGGAAPPHDGGGSSLWLAAAAAGAALLAGGLAAGFRARRR